MAITTEALLSDRVRPRAPGSNRSWQSCSSPCRVATLFQTNFAIVQAFAGEAASANGRTSIVPSRAEGTRAAMLIASSRFLASMRK